MREPVTWPTYPGKELYRARDDIILLTGKGDPPTRVRGSVDAVYENTSRDNVKKIGVMSTSTMLLVKGYTSETVDKATWTLVMVHKVAHNLEDEHALMA